MAEQLSQEEIEDIKELLIDNMIQIQTVHELLVDKGVFSEDEFYAKLGKIRDQYRKKN